MVATNFGQNCVKDFETYYTSDERITSSQDHVKLSCSGDRRVVLEVCYEVKMVNMDAPNDLSNSYFYLHLSIIHDLGVIIPFTKF